MNSKFFPYFGEPKIGAIYEERPGSYALVVNERSELAIVETPNGVFLPGGGLEKHESPLVGLEREILEEIGAKVENPNLIAIAGQFLFSRHYRQHFVKIGHFYTCEFDFENCKTPQKEHTLIWLPTREAKVKLSEEFQRWVLTRF